ncbi:MAG: metallophosphoesterase [Oscillospiraceae bacterium]|nr:metallophosphoesterase [Oscillospiraceae bacterium]
MGVILKYIREHKLITALAALSAAAYSAGFACDRLLTTTFYELHTDKLGEGSLRIVNVSDLHNCRFGRGQKRLINAVKKLSPDIIVMSGDIAAHDEHSENSRCFIRKASKLAPVYYTSGNHEHNHGEDNFRRIIRLAAQAGARVLNDRAETLTVSGNIINIIGVDDRSLYSDVLHSLLGTVDTGRYTVVIAHRPELIHEYCAEDADAVYCGHAHGGQVRLPFIGGLFASTQGLFPKYTEGVFTENNTSVIVSRGVGNHVFLPRFFNLPEIVVTDISK